MSPHWYRTNGTDGITLWNSNKYSIFQLDDDAQDILMNGSGSTIIHFEFTSETDHSTSIVSLGKECMEDFKDLHRDNI